MDYVHFFMTLKSHFTTFGLITLIGFLFLVLICLKITSPYKKPLKENHVQDKSEHAEPKLSFSHEDFKAIAGDDLIATQLDLARAYIEMNERKIAKTILTHVRQKGSPVQQQEASKLITSL